MQLISYIIRDFIVIPLVMDTEVQTTLGQKQFKKLGGSGSIMLTTNSMYLLNTTQKYYKIHLFSVHYFYILDIKSALKIMFFIKLHMFTINMYIINCNNSKLNVVAQFSSIGDVIAGN